MRPGRAPKALSPESERALLDHPWPGNVRELENVIQRALLTASGEVVTPANLGLTTAPERPAEVVVPAGPLDAERRSIEHALVQADGVVARAATELGLSRQALYRRMEKLGIVLERRPRD